MRIDMRWLVAIAFAVLVLASCRASETPTSVPTSVPTNTPVPMRAISIVGHRGAAGIAPENTLASFQKALDLGVAAIELDVHLSKDNELVVIHDPMLDRTTDGAGPVQNLTLAELLKLNASAKYKGAGSFDVQRIPTLQQVYDLVGKRAQIYIEIKLASDNRRYPDIEQKVIEVVRKNNAVSSTRISSFDFATVRQIQTREPTIGREVIISTAYLRNMGLQGKGPNDIAADLTAQGARAVGVEKTYLSPALMSTLKQAGLMVGVWTVDDPNEMWKFLDLNVDAVTTNRPDLLLVALKQGRPK